jgi:NTP pyrophosphatase (non-canonical NTP hydrolase)
MQTIDEIFDEVKKEIKQANEKFPYWPTDQLHAVAVVGEEAGELLKAVLEATYQFDPIEDRQIEHIKQEAIQTAAMAIRFLLSMSRYTFNPSLQHKQE